MSSKLLKVDVSFLPRVANPHEIVVVIDVLRFTTTAAVALHHGVNQIIPCANADDCKQSRQPGELLAGEKQGSKIPGFDLGNSPSAFLKQSFHGRNFRFATSNGSPTCIKASSAAKVYLGSFVNLATVSKRLAESNQEIVLMCSGAKGETCSEDSACAGAIVQSLAKQSRLEMTENAKLALELWARHDGNLRNIIFDSAWGRKLAELGLNEDLEVACQLDLVSTVPVLLQNPLRVCAENNR